MKFNKRIFITLALALLLSASVVFAASSSDYLTKAQKYIDRNCSKSSISNQTSLNCYLFYKLGEIETQVNSNTSRITALENVPSPSPSPSPSPFAHKELKTFDANDVELGLYADTYIFFYPDLERFVRINSSTGSYDTWNVISFTGANCTGDAYKSINNTDMNDVGKFVFNSGDSGFFVVDGNTPSTTVSRSSFLDTGVCTNTSGSITSRKLREVSLPLPNPVAFPLKYKYQ